MFDKFLDKLIDEDAKRRYPSDDVIDLQNYYEEVESLAQCINDTATELKELDPYSSELLFIAYGDVLDCLDSINRRLEGE